MYAAHHASCASHASSNTTHLCSHQWRPAAALAGMRCTSASPVGCSAQSKPACAICNIWPVTAQGPQSVSELCMHSRKAALLQAIPAAPRALWRVSCLSVRRLSFLAPHLIEQHTHVMANVTPLVRVALLGQVSVGRLDLLKCCIVIHLTCCTHSETTALALCLPAI